MPALDAAAALDAITALIKRRRESLGFTAAVPAFYVNLKDWGWTIFTIVAGFVALNFFSSPELRPPGYLCQASQSMISGYRI